MTRLIVIKIFIVIICCFALFFGVVWLWNYKTNLPVPDNRTAHDFIKPLRKQEPQLFNSKGKPVFSIINIDHTEKNWYIITIKAKGDDSGIRGKIVINDPYFDSGHMKVIRGPEVLFSEMELAEKDVPTKTIQEALK